VTTNLKGLLDSVQDQGNKMNEKMQELIHQKRQIEGQLNELSGLANQLVGQRDLLQQLLTTELSEPESECEGGDNPSEE